VVAAPAALLCAALAGTTDEPVIAPVRGAFQLEGHGYGHGRGMSQWGAQGAAVSGVNYRRILSTYYPGTVLVRQPDNPRLHVLITAADTGDLRVLPGSGLRVQQGQGPLHVLPTAWAGRSVTEWRARPDGVGLQVAGRAAGAWHTLRVDRAASAEPIRFTAPGHPVRLVLPKEIRDYRGDLRAQLIDGDLRVVNGVNLEGYLRSVVPSESLSTWAPDALAAQAVAARSYARWRADHARAGGTDICDTAACQAYHGVRRVTTAGRVTRWEATSTDRAVARTAGELLDYRGTVAFTEFSSSNGGWSRAGDAPYLVAKPDPWDGVVRSSDHLWHVAITPRQITRHWPRVGRIIGIAVHRRDGRGDWGGRVLSVKLIGTRRTLTVPGGAFSSALQLRDSWWHAAEGGIATPSPSPSSRPTLPALPELPIASPRPR
jgi:SpoIID/LytB domain protein